jgi:rubrerythrin
MPPRPVLTVEEFYAHALAIEHEAARCYAEFEAHFADRGDDVLAGLCRNLAQLESEHFELLVKSSAGMGIPAIQAGSHQWLAAEASETAAREFLHRVATTRQLLEIALQSECNALGFFEWVAHTAPDGAVRSLARAMAQEEMEHVHWVQNALEYCAASSRTGREAGLERQPAAQ